MQVVEVVERQLLAVELGDPAEQVAPRAAFGVVGGALVRVLAVGELHHLLVVAQDVAREVAFGLGEPVGDQKVVVGRAVEGLGGEVAAGGRRELAAVCLELVEHGGVVVGFGDDGHALVVLGGGADHGGPADVDHLDDGVLGRAALRGDLFERIEADDDHVDRLDAVLGDGLHVLGVVAPGQDARLDARVHGLDAAAEHLGELGDVGHLGDRDALVAEHPGGAAGRDDLDSHAGQGARELFETGFVEDGDESSFDLHSGSLLGIGAAASV